MTLKTTYVYIYTSYHTLYSYPVKPNISHPNAASRKTAGLFADTHRKIAGHFFVMISNPTIYKHIFDITIYYLYTYIYIYVCIYIIILYTYIYSMISQIS